MPRPTDASLALDAARDLLCDARATRRHVRQEPRPDATALLAYADDCLRRYHLIRHTPDIRSDQWGMPILPTGKGAPTSKD